MAIPVWTPGQVLTASDVNSWLAPTAVIKPSDTARASNTTLTNDPALVIAGVANATYKVTGLILYNGANAGGYFQFRFTVPAGGACNIATLYEYTAGAADAGVTLSYLQSSVTITRIAWTGGIAVTYGVALSGTYITTGTAGNLNFQWSQNISNATATTVQQNSYLSLQRIA